MEQNEILMLMETTRQAADISQTKVTEMLDKLGGSKAGVTLQQFKDATSDDPKLMECFGKLFGAGAMDDTTEVVHRHQAERMAAKKQVGAMLRISHRFRHHHGRSAANAGRDDDRDQTSARLQTLAMPTNRDAGAAGAGNASLALHRREQYHQLQKDEGVADIQWSTLVRSTADQVRIGLDKFDNLRLEDASDMVLQLQVRTAVVMGACASLSSVGPDPPTVWMTAIRGTRSSKGGTPIRRGAYLASTTHAVGHPQLGPPPPS